MSCRRNKILRWKIVADLVQFGGNGIKVIQRQIPIIIDPYDGVDWAKVKCVKVALNKIIIPPQITLIEVDNYQGIIKVVAYGTNRIQWWLDNKLIKQKFNFGGKFVTEFYVENLKSSNLRFKLIGKGGEIYSDIFKLHT